MEPTPNIKHAYIDENSTIVPTKHEGIKMCLEQMAKPEF
jgi:hypothetical protein